MAPIAKGHQTSSILFTPGTEWESLRRTGRSFFNQDLENLIALFSMRYHFTIISVLLSVLQGQKKNINHYPSLCCYALSLKYFSDIFFMPPSDCLAWLIREWHVWILVLEPNLLILVFFLSSRYIKSYWRRPVQLAWINKCKHIVTTMENNPNITQGLSWWLVMTMWLSFPVMNKATFFYTSPFTSNSETGAFI